MKKEDPDFFRDLEIFKDQQKNSKKNYISKIELNENQNIDRTFLSIDWVYTNQNYLAFQALLEYILLDDKNKILKEKQKLKKNNVDRYFALDVGSQWTAVSLFTTVCPFLYVDPNLHLDNNSIKSHGSSVLDIEGTSAVCNTLDLAVTNSEAQNLPFNDKQFELITSLHAVEHFGLGRYKDTVDFNGDINGLKEFNRVLKDDGIFIVSVPVVPKVRERIVFNENRLYHPETFVKMLVDSGFIIIDYSFLLANDHIAHRCAINTLDHPEILKSTEYNHDYGLICVCKKDKTGLKL